MKEQKATSIVKRLFNDLVEGATETFGASFKFFLLAPVTRSNYVKSATERIHFFEPVRCRGEFVIATP